MSMITKPSISKGFVSQFTLSKSYLLNHSKVIADSYFSDSSNWFRVEIIYRSEEGNQHEIVEFDATQENPVGNFLISERARDVFEVQKLRILDFDGGFLEIPRSDLIVADFDISIGGNSLSTFTIIGDGTMTNENGVLTKTDDLGNAVVAYSDNFSSYPEDSTVEFEISHIGSEYFVGMGFGAILSTAQEMYGSVNSVFNLIVKSDGSLRVRSFFGSLSLSGTASVGDKFKIRHSQAQKTFYIYKNDFLIIDIDDGGRFNDNPQSYPKRAVFSTVNQNTSVKDLNFKSSPIIDSLASSVIIDYISFLPSNFINGDYSSNPNQNYYTYSESEPSSIAFRITSNKDIIKIGIGVGGFTSPDYSGEWTPGKISILGSNDNINYEIAQDFTFNRNDWREGIKKELMLNTPINFEYVKLVFSEFDKSTGLSLVLTEIEFFDGLSD